MKMIQDKKKSKILYYSEHFLFFSEQKIRKNRIQIQRLTSDQQRQHQYLYHRHFNQRQDKQQINMV